MSSSTVCRIYRPRNLLAGEIPAIGRVRSETEHDPYRRAGGGTRLRPADAPGHVSAARNGVQV
jgi:hypothetical protein